jgi:branched-chain amino acid aminotransferase
MTPVCWLDGRLVDAAQARVPVSDRGFTLGDGVFETLKVVLGAPFALTRHLDRLRDSAAILGLSVPAEPELRRAVAEVAQLVAADPIARLRITVSSGAQRCGPPTLAVVAAPASPVAAGESVLVVPWRRNEHGATAGAKTTSCVENQVALIAAGRAGAGEALFANTAGQLCEGATTNVFVVFDGVAVTPPLVSGCLPGIARSLVLRWCPQVVERPIELGELADAEEMFLTSSLRDVQPVHSVDGRRPGGPKAPVPGPVTAGIIATYAAAALRDADPR